MRTPRRPPSAFPLILAYLAFVSLGLPDGLLGVGWPSIRSDFRVPTEAVGLLLATGTLGYLTSSVVAGFVVRRLGVGRLLAASTALAGLALVGYASTPGLTTMAGCALALGLGSGAVDSGLNAYAARAFGPRHMNWIHASFGLGVTLGPLIMTSALAAGLAWRWGYGIVAATQAALAVAFVANARSWRDRPTHPSTDDDPGAPATVAMTDVPTFRATLALPALWRGALAFTVYVAVEVGAGLWAFLLLTEGKGVSRATAGICVSIYWGSLFVGRVVQGVAAERLGSDRVLGGGIAGMAVGAVLMALPGPAALTIAGLAVLGFAAAPVFPLLTLTTVDRVGAAHADRAVGLQIGAAGAGAAVVPTAIGLLLVRFGVGLLGPCLVVLCVLLLVLHVRPVRPTRPGAAGRSASDAEDRPPRRIKPSNHPGDDGSAS